MVTGVPSTPLIRARYHRRRRRPAAILVGVLVLAMAMIWVVVAVSGDEESAGCPDPEQLSAVESAGRVVAYDDLAAAAAPPGAVRVHVFNGNGSYGQARVVTSDLEKWGFVSAAPPGNDPRFPEFGLECHGQIRFGAAGESAARTLSLTVPCAELVRLDRSEDVVDLALGDDFKGLTPTDAALAVLTELQRPGSEASAVAAERLREARNVTC